MAALKTIIIVGDIFSITPALLNSLPQRLLPRQFVQLQDAVVLLRHTGHIKEQNPFWYISGHPAVVCTGRAWTRSRISLTKGAEISSCYLPQSVFSRDFPFGKDEHSLPLQQRRTVRTTASLRESSRAVLQQILLHMDPVMMLCVEWC